MTGLWTGDVSLSTTLPTFLPVKQEFSKPQPQPQQKDDCEVNYRNSWCELGLHEMKADLGSSRWKKCLRFRDVLTSEGHVAVEEASLEDEAQYAGTAHPLLLPSCHTAQ